MAEIRKHDPDAGEGIARLVRQHMGDVRPVEPGEKDAPEGETKHDGGPGDEGDDIAISGLTAWDESGPTFQF